MLSTVRRSFPHYYTLKKGVFLKDYVRCRFLPDIEPLNLAIFVGIIYRELHSFNLSACYCMLFTGV